MQIDLDGEWYGWKQRGRYLVSPEGDKLTLERMKGIAWRLHMEERLTACRARNASRKAVRQQLVKVVVLDLADWHAQRFGTRAG